MKPQDMESRIKTLEFGLDKLHSRYLAARSLLNVMTLFMDGALVRQCANRLRAYSEATVANALAMPISDVAREEYESEIAAYCARLDRGGDP